MVCELVVLIGFNLTSLIGRRRLVVVSFDRETVVEENGRVTVFGEDGRVTVFEEAGRVTVFGEVGRVTTGNKTVELSAVVHSLTMCLPSLLV